MEQINNSVLVQGATLADIEAIVNRAIDKRMASFYESIREKPSLLVKRIDAAKVLGISLPTLDAYAKANIIHAKRVGGRVYFSDDELHSLKRTREKRGTSSPIL